MRLKSVKTLNSVWSLSVSSTFLISYPPPPPTPFFSRFYLMNWFVKYNLQSANLGCPSWWEESNVIWALLYHVSEEKGYVQFIVID